MTRWPLLVMSGAGTFILALVIFVQILEPPLSPGSSAVIAEQCFSLEYGGTDKVNIVFLAPERTAQRYADYFFSIEPFASKKNEFNIFYVDYNAGCELYHGIALLCSGPDVIRKAALCPSADVIIVPKAESKDIRSSAYQGIASLNTNHPSSVLAHEFGHIFANFAEEYLTNSLPIGQPNCKSSCGEFEKADGCFKECSKSNYYRSVENGFMRTLETDHYGIFNENIIEKEIAKETKGTRAAGLAVQTIADDCLKKQYYLIEARMSDGKLEIASKSLERGCAPEINGAWSYELISKDRRIKGSIPQPIIFSDIPEDRMLAGETFESQQAIYISIPFVAAEGVEFFNENNQLVGKTAFDGIREGGSMLCEL